MASSYLRKLRYFSRHFIQSLREHVHPNYQVWAKCIILYGIPMTSLNVAARLSHGSYEVDSEHSQSKRR